MNATVIVISISVVIMMLLLSSSSYPFSLYQAQAQKQVSLARCPDGYHRSPSGDCEPVLDLPDLPRCPDGYHRSPSGICEPVSNLPAAIHSCPIGYQRSADGLCIPVLGPPVVNPYQGGLPSTTIPSTTPSPTTTPVNPFAPQSTVSQSQPSTRTFTQPLLSSSLPMITNQSAQANQTSGQNLTQLIEERFTRPETSSFGTPFAPFAHVDVIFESPKTIVLYGNLITFALNANDDLWEAVDLLKTQYGFKLTHIVKEGEGSKANEGRIYLVMERP